ncbi:MAG: glycoside hydrolase family 16 protein [Treponema sp.]|nr:glycoside hydrolase family 16 protein [Treponema sp.]
MKRIIKDFTGNAHFINILKLIILTGVFMTASQCSIAPVYEGLIFNDEFDGTTLDRTKWDLCPQWDRQGRSSWRDDMVSVSGGNLRIRFTRDPALGSSKSNNTSIAENWIRSGGVRTRKQNPPYDLIFANSFGYYEARIKFPVVRGTWGAFWLQSPTVSTIGNGGRDGTEIDIVETIRNHIGEYNAALHWDGYGEHHQSVGGSERPVEIYDGDYHIFALEWTPAEYIFYVDDIVFWRVDGGSNFKNVGINQTPNYIKLTVESADWAGEIPQDFTEDYMLVDYVRVYSRKP